MEKPEVSSSLRIKKGDWIRFQVKADRRVLEGFVQKLTPDSSRFLMGAAPDSLQSTWYDLDAVTVLHVQHRF